MKRISNEWRFIDCSLDIPYPWYTREALLFLETLDFKGKKIFEYGVGDSTNWFRAKGARVYGVDTNLEWASAAGVKFARFNNEYIHAIDEYGLFDIVVIDGDWRNECVDRAIAHLKEGGLLIIDNFEQRSVPPNRWDNVYELLRDKQHKIYFEPEHQDWKTAIWTI